MPNKSFRQFVEKYETVNPAAVIAWSKLEDFLVLEKALFDAGIVSEKEGLVKEFSDWLGLPYINLRDRQIPIDILNIITPEVAKNYKIVAFDREGANLSVGLVDPYNYQAVEAIDFLAKKNRYNLSRYIISEESFIGAAAQYETLHEEVAGALEAVDKRDIDLNTVDIQAEDDDFEKVIKQAPVSKIVSVIIKHAVDGGASDIHIEPWENQCRVRYRVDGILHTSLVLPGYLHASIVSRVKVIATLKLDETRLPQDGRIRMTLGDKEVDLRISILPLLNKEKIVIRILDTSHTVYNLSELGFASYYTEKLNRNIQKPHGMVLVTGPTGSGKSTTLYSVLNLRNREDVNILTLEDPVEYSLKGINQSQIREDLNYTFAAGLRAILRQDPDIIMLGEVRDAQTAQMSIHAALTGHLIFSTIHTRDALGVIPRLIDLGVEPFLIASTLNLVIAQRLVRKICLNCKAPVTVPANVLKEVKIMLKELSSHHPELYQDKKIDLVFYQGKGCDKCHHSGYRGRLAIVEMLEITSEIQNLVASGFSGQKLKDLVISNGMITLKQDGLLRVLEGQTSLEELMRVTLDERVAEDLLSDDLPAKQL